MPQTGKDRPFAILAAELGYFLVHPGSSRRPDPRDHHTDTTAHTGLSEHSGFAPHSHEVRPDHAGVEKVSETPPATRLMNDPTVVQIDVRFFFGADGGPDPAGLLDLLSEVIQNSSDLADADFISAYEIVNDGFGNLTADDKPLA